MHTLDSATIHSLYQAGWHVVCDKGEVRVRCQHRQITVLESGRFLLENWQDPWREPVVRFDAAWQAAAYILGIDPDILLFNPGCGCWQHTTARTVTSYAS